MQIIVDAGSRRLSLGPTPPVRGETIPGTLTFMNGGVPFRLPAGTAIQIGVKSWNDPSDVLLAYTTATRPEPDGAPYTFSLSLNTSEMLAKFTAGVTRYDCSIEVKWEVSAGSGTFKKTQRHKYSVDADTVRDTDANPSTMLSRNDFLVTNGTGLLVNVAAGYAANGAFVAAQASLAITNATNYIEVTAAGVASVNTTAFSAGSYPLATVVASAGAITSNTDLRAWITPKPATGGVTSITGTANEITVTGTTTPTLSLPSALTFTAKTITGGTFSAPTLTTPTIGDGAEAAPSLSFTSDTNTGVYRPAADTVGIVGGGNDVVRLTGIASATDYLEVKNGIGVGSPLHVLAEGASTNIGMHLQPKGSGLLTISDGTDFNKGIRFRSSSSAASAITLLDAVSTAGRVITLPDATGTLALVSGNLGTPSALVGTNITGTASGLTAGNATLAATVTVANEATDTTCFPLFATAATGSLAALSNAGLTFNSATGLLSATGLRADTASDNAVTGVSSADGTGVVGQTVSGVAFSASASGSGGAFSGYSFSGKLLSLSGNAGENFVVANTGQLTLGGFGPSGIIVLNGSTSGSATITVSATGVLALPTGTTATNMTLTTPALGTPSAIVLTNASGTASGLTAGNATLAATVTVANEATDTTCFPLFATAATGSLAALSNADLTFNSATGLLSATGLAGAFNGTVGATTPDTVAGTTGTFDSTVTVGANGTAGTLNVKNSGGTTTASVDSDGIASFASVITSSLNVTSGVNGTTQIEGTGTLTMWTDTGSGLKWLKLDSTADSVKLYNSAGGYADPPTITFTSADGSASFASGVCTINGSGYAGAGSGLTALNASNISSGTLADARLSANVPLKDAANTFTAAQANSTAGAASLPAMKFSGVPFAGTGTTSFPLVYINDANATASTTLNTAGTYFGVNGDGTQDLMDLMKDGVSACKVNYLGTITLASATSGGISFGGSVLRRGAQIAGAGIYTSAPFYVDGSFFIGAGNGASVRMVQSGNGILTITEDDGSGMTRVNLGGATSSFPALQVTTGTQTITAGLADGTAGGAFVASGTLAVTGATTLSGVTNNSANSTGVTTASSAVFNANSLTTGTGIYLASSTLTSGKAMDIQVSGTAAAASQTALNVATAGANGTSGITSKGAVISNTHTGTTSTNTALELTASGGTTNVALNATAGHVLVPDGSYAYNTSVSPSIGRSAVAANSTSQAGILLGDNTVSILTNSIRGFTMSGYGAFGNGALISGIGTSALTFYNTVISTSSLQAGEDKTSTPNTGTVRGGSGSGTNIAGGVLHIQGGASTGSAAGGSILLRTTPAGGAGSSANAAVTALTIDSTQAATFAGTLAVTGATTLTGNLTSNGAYISTPQALSGNGAVAAVNLTTEITTIANTGTANTTTTLAAGTNGQKKVISFITDGGFDAVITVTNPAWGGAGTITMNDALDNIELRYLNSVWQVFINNGCTLA